MPPPPPVGEFEEGYDTYDPTLQYDTTYEQTYDPNYDQQTTYEEGYGYTEDLGEVDLPPPPPDYLGEEGY